MSILEPVPGYQHRSPGNGFWPWHQAIDIPAPGGTPVRAVGAGMVASAGEDGLSPYNLDLSDSGGGKLVTIRHRLVDEGILGLGTVAAESQYAHLSAINPAVRRGAVVPAGFVIGHVGRTGTATGNHLHFGFRVGGIWRDYREFLPGMPRSGARLDAEGATTAPAERATTAPAGPSTIPMPASRRCPSGYVPAMFTTGGVLFDLDDPAQANVCARRVESIAGEALDIAGGIARNLGLFLLFAVILVLGLWALVRQSG